MDKHIVQGKESKGEIVIGTHDGVHHADELGGIGLVLAVLPKIHRVHPGHLSDRLASMAEAIEKVDILIVRTRKPESLALCDLVLDVGGFLDYQDLRFDHHQGGIPNRPNGIPYAACGLILEWLKSLLPEGSRIMGPIKALEDSLVLGIDAADNGVNLLSGCTGPAIPLGISQVISGFNPGWRDSNPDKDAGFYAALEVMEAVINNIFEQAWDEECAESMVKEYLEDAILRDDVVIIMDRFVPFSSHLPVLDPDHRVLYVVYPAMGESGNWMVQAAPQKPKGFETVKPLPAAWACLRDKELADLTGVDDAVFAHKNLFIGGAKTKEGAIRLARLAVEA